jgi:hypothetical protein
MTAESWIIVLDSLLLVFDFWLLIVELPVWILNNESWIQEFKQWAVTREAWVVDIERWTMNRECWIVNHERNQSIHLTSIPLIDRAFDFHHFRWFLDHMWSYIIDIHWLYHIPAINRIYKAIHQTVVSNQNHRLDNSTAVLINLFQIDIENVNGIYDIEFESEFTFTFAFAFECDWWLVIDMLRIDSGRFREAGVVQWQSIRPLNRE